MKTICSNGGHLSSKQLTINTFLAGVVLLKKNRKPFKNALNKVSVFVSVFLVFLFGAVFL